MNKVPIIGGRTFDSVPEIHGSVYDTARMFEVASGHASLTRTDRVAAPADYRSFDATSSWVAAWDAAPSAPNNGRRRRPRPLQVVHVGPCMLRGGSEQWLINLVRFLDPSRIQLSRCIVGLSHLIDPKVVADLGVPVEVGQAESVQQAARECDVVVFWGLPLKEWLGDVRPKLCVYIAHGEGDWTRETLESSHSVVDHVVAVSRRAQERVCNGTPSTVIANGVDTAHLTRTVSREQMRQSLGFRPGDFVLGFIGRFSSEKRPHVIVDAVAQLPRNFKALFVGWGAAHGQLVDLANAKIPGRYAFTEASRHLGNYYQALDALCMPSEHEGFGLVMLEAMMCERPVIACPVGAAPELIRDRINGILVDGTPESIAAATQLLYHHPTWARGIATEGRTIAERHGHASRMASEYQDLLERLWIEKFDD